MYSYQERLYLKFDTDKSSRPFPPTLVLSITGWKQTSLLTNPSAMWAALALAFSSPSSRATKLTLFFLTWHDSSAGYTSFLYTLTVLDTSSHIPNGCLYARECQRMTKNRKYTAWGIGGLSDSFMYRHPTVAQCLLPFFRQAELDETPCFIFGVYVCVYDWFDSYDCIFYCRYHDWTHIHWYCN